jgi:hypothetical protein
MFINLPAVCRQTVSAGLKKAIPNGIQKWKFCECYTDIVNLYSPNTSAALSSLAGRFNEKHFATAADGSIIDICEELVNTTAQLKKSFLRLKIKN